MADWNQPVLADLYPDFMDRLKARDLDSMTLMGVVSPINVPIGAFWFDRVNNVFKEWNGTTWITKVIGVTGGGTGSGTTPPALGTMASQNANAVNITGGSFTNAGNIWVNGSIANSGVTYLRNEVRVNPGDKVLIDANGRIIAINSTYFASLDGAALVNMNASQLTFGAVHPNRLGTGAVGDGSKILLDNFTWVSKNLVGGGMVEIVHNDSGFGTDETVKTVNIGWSGPTPTSGNQISIQANSAMSNIGWKVLNGTQFQLILPSPVPGAIVNWTAFHWQTQV